MMLHTLNVVLLAGWQTLLATWQVLGEMSPFLLFGFALAGLLSIWISPEWTERLRTGAASHTVWHSAAALFVQRNSRGRFHAAAWSEPGRGHVVFALYSADRRR